MENIFNSQCRILLLLLIKLYSLNDDIFLMCCCIISFVDQPGNGSRYVRHLDVSKTGRVGSRRKITAIFYFNRSWSGGQLRVYSPSKGSENTPGREFLDIDPKLGRVVVLKR